MNLIRNILRIYNMNYTEKSMQEEKANPEASPNSGAAE